MERLGDLVLSEAKSAESLVVDRRYVGYGGALIGFAENASIAENSNTPLGVVAIVHDNSDYNVGGKILLQAPNTITIPPSPRHRLFSFLVHCTFSYQPTPGFTIINSGSVYQIISATQPTSDKVVSLSLFNKTAKCAIQVGSNTIVVSHTVVIPSSTQQTQTLINIISSLPVVLNRLKIWTHLSNF